MNKHRGSNQGEDGSHINNIIDRLREVRDGGNQSEERSRDIVTRSDGTKVVKVRRRKRVYGEAKRDLNPSNGSDFKKWILVMGIAGILFCIVAIVFLMVRISSFNTEEFRQDKEEELAKAWNAQVEIKGLSFEGLSFSAGSIVARFPESSMIKEVTIQSVSDNLIPISFITGICQGDMMEIDFAKVILRNDANKMVLPDYVGRELWNYSRYRVARFEIDYEDPQAAPFRMTSKLYVRRAEGANRYNCTLGSKTLAIRGWDPITLTVGSIYLTHEGFEYIDINGTMSESTTVSIKGEFKEGMSLSNPSFTLTGVNIPLASMTKNQFTPLVSAEFGVPSDSHEGGTSFRFALPSKDQDFPPFSGESKNIRKLLIKNLPVFKELSDLTGNKAYLNPVLQSGKFHVVSDGNGIDISGIEASEFSFLSMTGAIKVSKDKNLSGVLNLGIPRRAGMKGDMIIDPLFVRDDGEIIWVDVFLSGSLSKPMDNIAQLVLGIKGERDKISREKNMIMDVNKSPSDKSAADDSIDAVKEFKTLLR